MSAARAMLFALVYCVCVLHGQVGADLTCAASNRSALRVTFDSHQNQTGLWTHSIGLINQGLPKGLLFDKKTDRWAVDVDYSPENCDKEDKDSLNVLISFSVIPVAKRNPDYKFYPGLGYYKYHPTLDTWTAAKEVCEKEGAHLAIINSQREADTLKQLIVNTAWAYLGLQKHDAKGEFITLFGEPLSKTGFSSWESGVNPANAAATHVAVLHGTLGVLSYSTTGDKRVSICEKEL